jgi:uncharacterized membrane protein YccC
VRPALDALDARIAKERSDIIARVSVTELASFSAITESLNAIGQLLERPLDEPPKTDPSASQSGDVRQSSEPDPTLMRHAAKVALCVVAGYTVGLISHRSDLSVILTTVIITALPTYGASLRKMILRIVGSVIGGGAVLLAIIVVTPNFETLPVYMITVFIVLFISGYASLASGRVAYAGKSIGTTFLLAFSGLSPAQDVYGPLWRLWGILLGTFVVTIVFFLLWPEYAGDSLMPRLRKVLRDTLALAPGGSAAVNNAAIHNTSGEITRVLAEMLEVADDAHLEGRTSLIDDNAVVEAAGSLRRIAHRLGAISVGSSTQPDLRLDPNTEAERDATLAAITTRLEDWLRFFESPKALDRRASQARAALHSRDEIAQPLEDFSRRLEANGYALINTLPLARRREILVELQSLRRVEFLLSQLDVYLANVPGAASAIRPTVLQQSPIVQPR